MLRHGLQITWECPLWRPGCCSGNSTTVVIRIRRLPRWRRVLPVAVTLGGQQLARSKNKRAQRSEEPVPVAVGRRRESTHRRMLFANVAVERRRGFPRRCHTWPTILDFAGAILIDLMLDRRILFQHGRVELVDCAPTGHTLLDQALQKTPSGEQRPAYSRPVVRTAR